MPRHERACIGLRRLLVRLLLVILLAGAAASAEQEGKQVRLGYFPNLTHAQALYARATGAFAKQFRQWLECSILGCGAGAAACVVVGSVVGPLAPPAIGGCTIAVCAAASYMCLW